MVGAIDEKDIERLENYITDLLIKESLEDEAEKAHPPDMGPDLREWIKRRPRPP